MPNVSVEVKTYFVATELSQLAAQLPDSVARRERHYRQRLATLIKRNASGRPGPQRISDDYHDSIEVRGPFVGTDHPAGRRLEFGYHGPDADGVTYDQHPYPHFQPAIDEVRPAFFASLERIVDRATREFAR